MLLITLGFLILEQNCAFLKGFEQWLHDCGKFPKWGQRGRGCSRPVERSVMVRYHGPRDVWEGRRLKNKKYTRVRHLKKSLKNFSPKGPRENVFPGPAVALDVPAPQAPRTRPRRGVDIQYIIMTMDRDLFQRDPQRSPD